MPYTFRARRPTAAEDTGKNTVAEAAEAVANDDEPADYESMTKAELIETANAQNIETAGLTKGQLIERLRA